MIHYSVMYVLMLKPFQSSILKLFDLYFYTAVYCCAVFLPPLLMSEQLHVRIELQFAHISEESVFIILSIWLTFFGPDVIRLHWELGPLLPADTSTCGLMDAGTSTSLLNCFSLVTTCSGPGGEAVAREDPVAHTPSSPWGLKVTVCRWQIHEKPSRFSSQLFSSPPSM